MKVVLDGKLINNERDFHRALSNILDFGPYYGNNLNALWDRLSTDIERPIEIIWINSEESRKKLGFGFQQIIKLFERLKQFDIEVGWGGTFDYHLE